jgi:hypothetical protein
MKSKGKQCRKRKENNYYRLKSRRKNLKPCHLVFGTSFSGCFEFWKGK